MRTIAIINQKGGCGKTTTAINLAACFARLGHATLLVDMDPQGHCATGLAVPEEQIKHTIFDTLIEKTDGPTISLESAVWQIATDFDLCPANLKLAGFEQIFAGRAGRERRLSNALRSASRRYEWCVIDCPPGVGLLTFNALFAADEVIVPVETGYFSLHGLARMMETLEELREKCEKDVVIRVLPTLYDTRTKLAREVLADLRGKFKDVMMRSIVNFNTKLKEAASFGQPITEYDPGSRGYKDFVQLARELMGERPMVIEPTNVTGVSRPAELVQRARQLAQISASQFGRTAPTTPTPSTPAVTKETSPAPLQPAAAVAQETAPRMRLVDDSEPAKSVAVTTQQKIDNFYGVKQTENGETMFRIRIDDANRVLIAGDFNNWRAMGTPMTRDAEGKWVARLPLEAGRYRYRLVVDGRWMTDPENGAVEGNEYGELNNIIEVR